MVNSILALVVSRDLDFGLHSGAQLMLLNDLAPAGLDRLLQTSPSTRG